jgi:hypothetical protein
MKGRQSWQRVIAPLLRAKTRCCCKSQSLSLSLLQAPGIQVNKKERESYCERCHGAAITLL